MEAEREAPDAVKAEPLLVHVASATGLVKLIDVAGTSSTLVHGKARADADAVALSAGRTRDELLVATRDGHVLLLGTNGEVHVRVSGFASNVAGAVLVDSASGLALLCCTEAGRVSVFTLSGDAVERRAEDAHATWAVDAPVERIAACAHVLAVGGKANRLALWDLTTQTRVYRARNPPDNWLGMSVPTWVSGIAIQPSSVRWVADEGAGTRTLHATVAVVSRYHELQLFFAQDASLRARHSLALGEDPLTCVCWSMDFSRLVVGNAVGVVWVIDVASWTAEGRMAPSCMGSVRDVRTCVYNGEEVVLATGLDRFVYCYRLAKRTLVRKVYAKQKMCRVLPVEPLVPELEQQPVEVEDRVVIKQEDSDEDVDWGAIDVVVEDTRKRDAAPIATNKRSKKKNKQRG